MDNDDKLKIAISKVGMPTRTRAILTFDRCAMQ